ncbi:MAG TPA: alpha/beta hydrolase, partial [Myxococcaceae bacterium]
MARVEGWIRRVGSGVLLLVSFLAATAAGLLIPYALAAWVGSLPVVTLASLAAFGVVAWLGTRAVVAVWPGSLASHIALLGAASSTLVFLAVLYILVLRPSASRFPEVEPYENTRYWTLATGSVIAHSDFEPPPGVTRRPEAIVYLHGGPGARQGPFDQSIYGGFASEGFRVVLFDQAGSGLSGFLPHLRDYTIARSVEDLEAVRRQIGVERMILIGHSWGSTLAASYMAKYPAHVAKVIFHSPARIWELEQEDFDFSRTADGRAGLPAPRLLAALLLRDRNRELAERLLSQQESEMLLIPYFRKTLGEVVCAGAFSKLPPELIELLDGHENPGVNPYVLQELVPRTGDSSTDPHPALRTNPTPAILLYPECNYLSWAGTLDYKKTFKNLKIYFIPRAGHYIQFEQPDLLRRVIQGFLLDRPEVLPAYDREEDPRGPGTPSQGP